MKLDPRRTTWVYEIVWWSSNLIFRIFFRCRYFHTERVPATGPVILASNHASYMDPPLVGSGIRRTVNYLARDTLFRYQLLNFIMKRLHCVPVDREGAGAAGLKGIFDRLSVGGVILLFPEGTRTADGKLLPARAGVGLTVIKSDAPVIPIRIFGTFEAYNRHSWIPRPHRIAIKYGKPLDISDLREEVKTCSKPRVKQIYQEVANRLMREIAAMKPEHDAP